MATKTSLATLAMVTVDCADPKREAEFWAAVLGWESPTRRATTE